MVQRGRESEVVQERRKREGRRGRVGVEEGGAGADTPRHGGKDTPQQVDGKDTPQRNTGKDTPQRSAGKDTPQRSAGKDTLRHGRKDTPALAGPSRPAALPIAECKDALVNVISANGIVVIQGNTGSGKSTQLPQYLAGKGLPGAGIVGVTQPRRVAATSVARRVAAEVGCTLGSYVGYAVRFDNCTSAETKIKFMTDGILLREAVADPDLEAYSTIIMDEAHERSLNTDVLFGVLRGIAARRMDFRVVVTSATLDAEKFAGYFGGVPTYTVPGRTFPVDIMYATSLPADYVAAAVKQALLVHRTHDPGDILIFMTGAEDIEATVAVLRERVAAIAEDEDVAPLEVLPMYSTLPPEQQERIFAELPPGTRKCVVATNIAETSLTIDGIRYVIDPGYVKAKVYNPRIGMDSLQVYPVSQAAANQRAGRAGRTAPGRAFRLYPESCFYHELLAANVPEIQRTNLANVLLLLKGLGVPDVRHFAYMDPPPRQNIDASLYQLWALGALDDAGTLTPRGRTLASLPLDPFLGALLAAGIELGCVVECLTIVAMLSGHGVFVTPYSKEEEARRAHEKFYIPESDHLTLLHVYQSWSKHTDDRAWPRKHYLEVRALLRARDIRKQLEELLVSQRIPLSTAGRDFDLVRMAVCSAGFMNAAQLKAKGQYIALLTGTPCFVHPSSALSGMGITADYVVYHELTYTSKEYMRTVTAVETEWLVQYGSKFFCTHEEVLQREREAERRAAALDGAGAAGGGSLLGLSKPLSFASAGYEHDESGGGAGGGAEAPPATQPSTEVPGVGAASSSVAVAFGKRKGNKGKKAKRETSEHGPSATRQEGGGSGSSASTAGFVFGKKKKRKRI